MSHMSTKRDEMRYHSLVLVRYGKGVGDHGRPAAAPMAASSPPLASALCSWTDLAATLSFGHGGP